MTLTTFKQVTDTLKRTGLTRAQSIALMPTWWAPEVAATPGGLQETILHLGRRLSLDPAALAEGEVRRVGAISDLRFKHTARVDPDSLTAATLVASSVAKAIVHAMPPGDPVPLMEASQVRTHLLAAGGKIDFDAILAFCWRLGVPVVPMPNLPKGLKKMDAAALRVGARPVIVLTKKSDSKAWLSFLLAHELGHVLLGHVPENGSIIEGSLRDTLEFDADQELDMQEREANEFAHELLGGESVRNVTMQWPENTTPVELALRAMDAADALRTGAGHLILRHAFVTNRWQESQIALRFLHDDVEAQAALARHLETHLNMEALAEDLQDYVVGITGMSVAD